MAKKLIWGPVWIFAVVLYGIAFLIVTPFELLSQIGEEMNEEYRD